MDMKINEAARAVQLPAMASFRSGNSPLSFGIVNSKRNGKRLTFSKALASALDITKSTAMLPIQKEGLLMVAKELPYESACPVQLKDDGGAKIAYNSNMVLLLTKVFNLTFEGHTSMSFQDITIDKLDDRTPVALIHIFDRYPAKDTASNEEQ